MTKELIENIRAIIVPYMAYNLRRINYENMGEIDAEQFSEDMNEILDLATKVLEQQPCEDAISRQAVEALFRNARKELMKQDRKEHIKDFNTRDLMLLNAEQFIHLLPSVTPQPKVGHWIRVELGLFDSVSIRWECSECKKSDRFRSNFCFNCGAKMESDGEE